MMFIVDVKLANLVGQVLLKRYIKMMDIRKRVEKIIISLTLYISLFNPFSAQH